MENINFNKEVHSNILLQIRLSNLLNIILLGTVIGLIMVLILPEKFLLLSRNGSIESIYYFEFILSFIYTSSIFLFTRKK